MTRSALPKKLRNADDWAGTDWDNWIQRPLLKIKHWLAFGPRATEWWARWRELPIVLVAMKGSGMWRWEESGGQFSLNVQEDSLFLKNKDFLKSGLYLSPIQYFSRWHFAVQWPFHLTFHFYFKDEYVPESPNRPGDTVKGKMIFARVGARRDSDKVYWAPSLFVGLIWN